MQSIFTALQTLLSSALIFVSSVILNIKKNVRKPSVPKGLMDVDNRVVIAGGRGYMGLNGVGKKCNKD